MNNILPLFPLPNVVLFPGCFLPLHIFEARYRRMIADIEKESRAFVLALLKPGWEPEYHKTPPVHEIACAARICACERLPDGRYNILVEGTDRVRVVDELHDMPYRRAVVSVIRYSGKAEFIDRKRVLDLLNDILAKAPVEVPEGLVDRLSKLRGDSLLADTVAHILQIPVAEKQSILETEEVTARLETVFHCLSEIRGRMG